MINSLFVLQIFSYLGFILTISYGSIIDIFLVIIGYFLVKCIGNAMTYHRLISHKSYQAPKWFYIIGNFFGTLGGQGSAIAWCANHIDHHRFSDQEQDPHSPKYKGFFWVQFLSMTGSVNIRYATILSRDKILLWFHNNYWYIHLTYVTIIVLIYPFGLFSLYLAPIALNWIFSGLLNNLTHMFGYKNFETKDKSHNLLLLGYLTFGEGWHNNHHADPKNSRHGYKWWELDFTHFLIKFIEVKKTYQNVVS